jgi:hypothetical protein
LTTTLIVIIFVIIYIYILKIWGIYRDVSDHSLIIIRYEEFDWGPKPFRFNNLWIKNKDFKEVVMGAWRNCPLNG